LAERYHQLQATTRSEALRKPSGKSLALLGAARSRTRRCAAQTARTQAAAPSGLAALGGFRRAPDRVVAYHSCHSRSRFRKNRVGSATRFSHSQPALRLLRGVNVDHVIVTGCGTLVGDAPSRVSRHRRTCHGSGAEQGRERAKPIARLGSGRSRLGRGRLRRSRVSRFV